MCQCQNNSCGSNCCCGSSCSCHENSSCCGSQSSCCGSQGQAKQGCDYAAKFLELADHAWMEVLKEKIKEKIKSNAKHMDELASLIAEANHERWQKKMEDKQCCGGFEEKLKNFFSHSCQNQGQKK